MFILGLEGKGRLGISISKKVLSSAVARNRIKRLIRETFRKNAKLFPKTDLNIIGRDNLSKEWKLLDYSDVQKQLISAARFVEENKKSE
jgi:ribonuclease P protein component